MSRLRIFNWMVLLLVVMSACQQTDTNETADSCNFINDPNNFFTIFSNQDPPHKAFNSFCKHIEVFSIPVYAFEGVDDTKLLHVANVLAQYLDNNEDGAIDQPAVYKALKSNQAYLVVWDEWENVQEFSQMNPPGKGMHIATADIPRRELSVAPVSEDKSLEVVWKLIACYGYAHAFPDVFGEHEGSELALAMDAARGGHFYTAPSEYPANAWYHNTQADCNYTCQLQNYLYLLISTHMGLFSDSTQASRVQDIWELTHREDIETRDTLAWQLLSSDLYQLPSEKPNGHYELSW